MSARKKNASKTLYEARSASHTKSKKNNVSQKRSYSRKSSSFLSARTSLSKSKYLTPRSTSQPATGYTSHYDTPQYDEPQLFTGGENYVPVSTPFASVGKLYNDYFYQPILANVWGTTPVSEPVTVEADVGGGDEQSASSSEDAIELVKSNEQDNSDEDLIQRFLDLNNDSEYYGVVPFLNEIFIYRQAEVKDMSVKDKFEKFVNEYNQLQKNCGELSEKNLLLGKTFTTFTEESNKTLQNILVKLTNKTVVQNNNENLMKAINENINILKTNTLDAYEVEQWKIIKKWLNDQRTKDDTRTFVEILSEVITNLNNCCEVIDNNNSSIIEQSAAQIQKSLKPTALASLNATPTATPSNDLSSTNTVHVITTVPSAGTSNELTEDALNSLFVNKSTNNITPASKKVLLVNLNRELTQYIDNTISDITIDKLTKIYDILSDDLFYLNDCNIKNYKILFKHLKDAIKAKSNTFLDLCYKFIDNMFNNEISIAKLKDDYDILTRQYIAENDLWFKNSNNLEETYTFNLYTKIQNVYDCIIQSNYIQTLEKAKA